MDRHLSIASMLWLLALGACGTAEATEQQFELPESPDAVVLYYEAHAYEIRAPEPIYELTVFSDGRAVGRLPSREPVEWQLASEELTSLLTDLTAAFSLSTEVLTGAHESWVAENGGPGISDGGTDRLAVTLDGYRSAPGQPFQPVSLDVAYENVLSYSRSLPEVAELRLFADAVNTLREAIREGYARAGS